MTWLFSFSSSLGLDMQCTPQTGHASDQSDLVIWPLLQQCRSIACSSSLQQFCNISSLPLKRREQSHFLLSRTLFNRLSSRSSRPFNGAAISMFVAIVRCIVLHSNAGHDPDKRLFSTRIACFVRSLADSIPSLAIWNRRVAMKLVLDSQSIRSWRT